MSLLTIGINHRTAPLALREQLAVSPRQLPERLAGLQRACTLHELVILSTCNRVEYYAVCADAVMAQTELVQYVSHHSGVSSDQLQAALYGCTDQDAIGHLFRVATGLDSMILGESEITAQIKQAYSVAQEQGTTGPFLNRLFQKALHCAKVVRARTRIAEGNGSIGSVVVALSRQLLGDRFQACDVLLWGAGKAAEVSAQHLIKSGIRHLWIVSRTSSKAQELAALCQSGWLSWERALHHLAHVDIAIICTQAPHYVIDASDIETIRAASGRRRLLLIDLAVPRNVDPKVANQPGILLVDVDDLQTVAKQSLIQRQEQLATCEKLIKQQVSYFWSRCTQHPVREVSPCDQVELMS